MCEIQQLGLDWGVKLMYGQQMMGIKRCIEWLERIYRAELQSVKSGYVLRITDRRRFSAELSEFISRKILAL